MTSLPDITDFRVQVRAFYDELPGRLAEHTDAVERMRAYRRVLDDSGFSGITIPVEFGGRGLPAEYEHAFREERGDRIVPEEAGLTIGIGMALPTILDHGSPELQKRFVPSGLRGEEIWCQLYSEPGAGSDLAGLTTRAVRDGDEWVVTGQKVWTSGAQHADLGIMLARTDPDLPKHRGITMFVIDMHQPAVEVRPLVQMTGVSEFNEVFLDEARVPTGWVVGDVNGGWSLAVALLGHERTALGGSQTTTDGSKSGRNPIPVDGLVELARDRGRLPDPVVRQELAALHTGERIRAWLPQRRLHPSIGKLWRTIQGRRAAQLAHRLGGTRAVAWEADDAEADYYAYHVLNCRGMSLGGGTDEVQRNTLGERVLGLPREPGPDRHTPFRELLSNDG
jgi:alkylation response protein AidB-like acyl-CoA dehydrogenase